MSDAPPPVDPVAARLEAVGLLRAADACRGAALAVAGVAEARAVAARVAAASWRGPAGIAFELEVAALGRESAALASELGAVAVELEGRADGLLAGAAGGGGG